MNEILQRMWENLIGRLTGPMNFRVVIQPAVAIILAIRAGLADARHGRPAFLWAAITNPAYRPELVREVWKDAGKVFILAAVLDATYQLIVLRWVYPGELLIVATALAAVPYVLVRGPINSIEKRFTRKQDKVGKHHRAA